MTLSVTAASKSYGAFPVLNDVDFEVAAGQVHALLGPNGAGKSTLIKCIGGVQPFTSGQLRLDGEVLDLRSPSDAFATGIATIHQHLSLIDPLSVSDNIFLGQELTTGPLLNKRVQAKQTQELLEQFNIRVRPSTQVGALAVGTKQLIEIAKAWHRTKVRVLILDEPTSALAEEETLTLFEQITRMRTEGTRVIYTTHRLGEIYKIADHVSVIRDGGVVLTGETSTIEPRAIVAAISGREQEQRRFNTDRDDRRQDRVALRVRGLAGPRFGPVSLEVRAGEVLGLYGVLGAGKTSLLETIIGGFHRESGDVEVDGNVSVGAGPQSTIHDGICFVPSERSRQSLWSTLSAVDNLLMPSYVQLSKRRWFSLRSKSAERTIFADTASRLDVQPPDPSRTGGNLSGGNQQKIVLGRWLLPTNLKVLVLDEPTQGVDVAARQKIYETCHELARRGVAVLFASSDADEVVNFADRVIVMDEGRSMAEYEGEQITENTLLSSAHELV